MLFLNNIPWDVCLYNISKCIWLAFCICHPKLSNTSFLNLLNLLYKSFLSLYWPDKYEKLYIYVKSFSSSSIFILYLEGFLYIVLSLNSVKRFIQQVILLYFDIILVMKSLFLSTSFGSSPGNPKIKFI